jgi:hypothetical protein
MCLQLCLQIKSMSFMVFANKEYVLYVFATVFANKEYVLYVFATVFATPSQLLMCRDPVESPFVFLCLGRLL